MKGKSRGYKDFNVYQVAYELALKIFTISKCFLKVEKSHAITATFYCYLTLQLKSRSMQ